MNEKQKAFAEYYIASFNATEAAKKAGYSEKTAYSHGQRLLKNVEIQKYIEEHALKARSERIADANEVLEYLTETMRSADEARRERTKAAELLGKRFGLFEEAKTPEGDGKEITAKQAKIVHIDAEMSDEDIAKALKGEINEKENTASKNE